MMVKCEHCGHEWDTNLMVKVVTCPNCKRKTRRGYSREPEDK